MFLARCRAVGIGTMLLQSADLSVEERVVVAIWGRSGRLVGNLFGKDELRVQSFQTVDVSATLRIEH